MEDESKRNPEKDPAKAAAHVASARDLLTALQEKIGKHPEIGAAITNLEMALNVLEIKTGGLL
jgi:hypothetical protein